MCKEEQTNTKHDADCVTGNGGKELPSLKVRASTTSTLLGGINSLKYIINLSKQSFMKGFLERSLAQRT
jgi:hypothetical protein